MGGKQALKVGGKGALRNTQLRRFSIVLSYPPPPRYTFSRHVSHQLKLTLNKKGDNVAVGKRENKEASIEKYSAQKVQYC